MSHSVTYPLNGLTVEQLVEQLREVTSSRIVSVSWDVDNPNLVTVTMTDDEIKYTPSEDYPDYNWDDYYPHEYECRTCGKETSCTDENGDCSWCRMVNNG